MKFNISFYLLYVYLFLNIYPKRQKKARAGISRADLIWCERFRLNLFKLKKGLEKPVNSKMFVQPIETGHHEKNIQLVWKPMLNSEPIYQ